MQRQLKHPRSLENGHCGGGSVNGGAAGVDNQTFEDNRRLWWGAMVGPKQEMESRTYRVLPEPRVLIAKPGEHSVRWECQLADLFCLG